MPQIPKPFFKQGRGLWYVEIDRKQANLRPDREAADRKYHKLLAQSWPQRSMSTQVCKLQATLDSVPQSAPCQVRVPGKISVRPPFTLNRPFWKCHPCTGLRDVPNRANLSADLRPDGQLFHCPR